MEREREGAREGGGRLERDKRRIERRSGEGGERERDGDAGRWGGEQGNRRDLREIWRERSERDLEREI